MDDSKASMDNSRASTKAIRDSALPLARIRTIMKSSADVGSVSQEAVFTVGKAAEFFLHYIVNKAHDTRKAKSIDYKDLSTVIAGENRFEFMRQIIPKKITVRAAQKIINQKESSADSSDEDSSSSDSVYEISSTDDENSPNKTAS